MKRELENQLAKDFSFMIAKNVFSGEVCLDEDNNTFGFPCSCGDGWYQVIHNLCQELTDFYVSKNSDPSEIEILQVKEKFGGLRFYTGGLIGGAHDIIHKHEDKSYEVCDVCGDPAEICIRGNWYRTLCDKHMLEYKYKRFENEHI
jgi:hypothetical protein